MRGILIKTFLSLMMLACVQVIVGQTYGPEISNITIDNGLSQNTVNSMLQDEQGFLWIGTNDGLNKFDGHDFKVFISSTTDSTSLSNNHVKSIKSDSNGNLWLATQAGLTYYDSRKGAFKRYYISENDPSSIAKNVINELIIDGNSIWLGTDQGLYFASDMNQISFEEIICSSGSGFNRINDLAQDDIGNILIASDNGVFQVDRKSKKCIEILFESDITEKEATSITYFENRVWVGSYSGLISFESENLSQPSLKHVNHQTYDSEGFRLIITKTLKDSNDVIWVGTQTHGVFILDPINNTLNEFIAGYDSNPHIFSTTTVTEIYEDHSGNVWIGSLETGVFKVRNSLKKFGLLKSMAGSNGLSSNRIRGLLEVGDDLWIASAEGLNRFDRNTSLCTVFKHDPKDRNTLASNDVKTLAIDGNGKLWVGTNDGLSILDTSTLEFSRVLLSRQDQKINSNKIRTVKLLSDGNIWVGSLGGGIQVIDPKTRKIVGSYFNEPSNNRSLSSNNVMNIFESSDQRVWIATYGGGLNLLNSSLNGFARINDADNCFSKLLTSIHEDPEGFLWVGSYGDGLYKIHPENFSYKSYNESTGLSNDVVYAAIPYGNSIWVSTNHGLNKLNRLIRNISKYNVTDGLQSNEFNSGSYLKSKTGELFFGGVNGLTFFYPDSIRSNDLPPRPAFTGFRIFNKQVEPNEIVLKGQAPIQELVADSGRVQLSHFHNVFTVEFASLDYSSPEDNTYAYQLVGFDRDWIYVDSDQRAITYTNLKPGQYTFQMKAANDDGVWNEQPIQLFIEISPALWQRLWFRLLVLFTVVSLIVTYVYRRITKTERRRKYLESEIKKHTKEIYEQNEILLNSENHLKSLNRKKDQMFYALAHHVRGPLTSLFSLMKQTNNDTKIKVEEREKYVSKLNEKVGHSLLLLDNTYYWSLLEFDEFDLLKETVDICQLTRECIDRHTIAAKAKNIAIDIENAGEYFVQCDKNMTAIIIQNLITNAIKYSHKNDVIKVTFNRDESKVKLVVEDNGVGINETELEQLFNSEESISTVGTQNEKGSGLGLQLSNRLAKKMNFDLFADCKKSCTKFYLDMPL